jgi:hypothetical protein
VCEEERKLVAVASTPARKMMEARWSWAGLLTLVGHKMRPGSVRPFRAFGVLEFSPYGAASSCSAFSEEGKREDPSIQARAASARRRRERGDGSERVPPGPPRHVTDRILQHRAIKSPIKLRLPISLTDL